MAAVRKTVTVLFCDLAESTRLGEELDPETLRERLARWHEAMRAAVERHGGTVEKFIGDAVMAVFGVPQVHEDDAVRAVRAAVEMRETLNGLGVGFRIGVNTGEVAAGVGETLVTGDAVNTAKRLEEAAPTGEILLGAATRRLVENAVRLEPAGAAAAKGKREPIAAWRVVEPIPDATPIARRLDAPLVGRQRELESLRAELAAAGRERACRLVTVLGAAGVGKSRLASEFVGGLGGRARVLGARCLPYGEGIAFLPLTDLIRTAGGEEAICAAVADQPDGELILARLEPGGSSEDVSWATRRLLETLARDRPLVVCLEDVHWAQPSFLDLLEYLAGWSRGSPVLLLCLARPDLLEARPHWGGPALRLEPLNDREAAALLDALAAEWPLAEGARTRAAAAAEGNPLFLEQLVAMLSEGGGTDEIPPTIHALLAARLDRLDELERTVLGCASVAGREFWRGAVAELTPALDGGAVGAALLSLVRKELVRPAPSTFLGEDGFRFRHALIRDAAYAEVPKRRRVELHARFAAWLERREVEPELVGYHLEQAYLAGLDLGEPDAELAVRAGELLGAAGTRAAARDDAAAGVALLRRALALLPDAHPSRAELLQELSAALWLAGEFDEAERALTAGIEAARARGDERQEWYGRLTRAARSASSRGDTADVAETARQAIAYFEQVGDDRGLARAWRRIGLVAHIQNRYAEAADAFERAVAHAEASGNEQERSRAADALAASLLAGPAPVPAAIARVERLLESTRGNVVLEAHVTTSLAGLVAMRGDFARARTLAAQAAETYEQLGLRLPSLGWAEVVCGVELLAGDPAAGADALRKNLTTLEQDGYERMRAYHAALLAYVLAEGGAHQEAARALEPCEHAPEPETSAWAHAARALIAEDVEEREAHARAAVDQAERTDSLNLQATTYRTLARVTGDPVASEAARRLYEAKGNLVAAAALRESSLQT